MISKTQIIKNIKNVFIILILTLFFSCNNKLQKINFSEFYQNFLKNEIDIKYKEKNYYLLRNDIYRYKSNIDDILFKIDSDNIIILSAEKKIDCKDSLRIKNEIVELKKTINRLHIVALYSNHQRMVVCIDTNFINKTSIKSNVINDNNSIISKYSLLHYYIDYKTDSLLTQLHSFNKPIILDNKWYIY